ncbi:MAG: DUF2892 domain-containing protein [Candidatus Ozemobacteraceae bacterium]
MFTERIVRIVAGTMVLAGVTLSHYVSPWWSLLPVFVGANLLQSGFTRWCLLEDILRYFGVRSCCVEADKREAAHVAEDHSKTVVGKTQ